MFGLNNIYFESKYIYMYMYNKINISIQFTEKVYLQYILKIKFMAEIVFSISLNINQCIYIYQYFERDFQISKHHLLTQREN